MFKKLCALLTGKPKKHPVKMDLEALMIKLEKKPTVKKATTRKPVAKAPVKKVAAKKTIKKK